MLLESIKEKTLLLKNSLSLSYSPIGVKFIYNEEDKSKATFEILSKHRYCQALMKARQGKHVYLGPEDISCPAASAAFGFKPLPEGLKNGKGLKEFGIVSDEKTGKKMFELMPTIDKDKLKGIYLFPLEESYLAPDIVIIEDEVEKLMWIALAQLNIDGGQRIKTSTSVLQATCVDVTIIPYLEQKLNMSFGCYGCRDATDIGPNESVLGFPFKDFGKIIDNVTYLSKKAIVNSRSKKAYSTLSVKNEN